MSMAVRSMLSARTKCWPSSIEGRHQPSARLAGSRTRNCRVATKCVLGNSPRHNGSRMEDERAYYYDDRRTAQRDVGGLGRTLHRVHSFLFEEGLTEQEQRALRRQRYGGGSYEHQEQLRAYDEHLEEQMKSPFVKIEPQEGVDEVRLS